MRESQEFGRRFARGKRLGAARRLCFPLEPQRISTGSVMDAFSYLSVLISVILGFAIQQVLLGYRALILSRRRIRFYAPPLIWSALLVGMVAQHWWASFGLAGRAQDNWSFALFATILVQTALIYMMTAIVLPDIPHDQPVDLRDHYYREAPAFFGVATAAILWSLFREYMLEGRLPEPANLAFHLLFVAASVTAMVTRRPRMHEGLLAVMTIAFVAYVAVLFSRLEI